MILSALAIRRENPNAYVGDCNYAEGTLSTPSMRETDHKPGRSKWSSREGERWWWAAATSFGGASVIALLAVAVIAILMEELWIVLGAIAVLALAALLMWSFLNGDSWGN